MGVRYPHLYRVGLIGIWLVSFWLGCASLDQKFEEANVTQKMKEWQVALKKKLSFDDDPSASHRIDSVEKGATAAGEQSSETLVHTVQRRGETLALIAKWYTGKSENWKPLVKANPGLNPRQLKIGGRVNIPGNLLVTRAPISAEFADQHLPTYFEHTVHWPGETLSLIAKWYSGKYSNWKKIMNHNPEIDPKRIKLGQIIYLPTHMLNTRQALPQKVAAKNLPDYFAYTVQRQGESLAEIARWYTGDADNWQAIARANPDVDPKYLLVGNEIYIPAKLLKTRESIQTDADDISQPKPEKQAPPAKPAATPKKKKDIQLFGPKPFPTG